MVYKSPGTSFTQCRPRDLTCLQVDPPKDGVVVDDVPDSISDFLESDVLPRKRIAQEVLTREKVEGPTGGDRTDLEVARILGLPEATRVRFGRRLPSFRGEVTIECFMRSFVVVSLLEEIEAPLLLGEIRRGWPGRLPLQIFVHTLVLAILLRTRRADSLMHNPKLHPPDVEFAESVDSPRGEWGAVIRPDRVRKPMFTKQGPKGGFHAFCANRGQALA